MKLYRTISKIPFLKSYSQKFLFIAFIGIHIPLLGIILWLLYGHSEISSKNEILVITIVSTAFACFLTLIIMNELLKPVHLARKTLSNYLQKNELPNLPENFKDEIGFLLKDLQFAITELDQLLKEKKDLLALLSHELRSPANSTLSSLELLEEDLNPEQIDYIIQQAKISTRKQLELMETVLELMRSDEAITSEHFKSVELKLLLNNSKELYQMNFDKKDIRLEVEISPDVSVKTEPRAFQQVLNNLINNAIKFSYRGSSILIRAYRQGNVNYIEVIDSGIGFEQNHAEEIFERFTSYARKGTEGEVTYGIGLYLIRSILKRLGGKIYAYSNGLNSGSTFTIELNN